MEYQEVPAKVVREDGQLRFQFGRQFIPVGDMKNFAKGMVGKDVRIGVRQEPGGEPELAWAALA